MYKIFYTNFYFILTFIEMNKISVVDRYRHSICPCALTLTVGLSNMLPRETRHNRHPPLHTHTHEHMKPSTFRDNLMTVIHTHAHTRGHVHICECTAGPWLDEAWEMGESTGARSPTVLAPSALLLGQAWAMGVLRGFGALC